MTIRDMKGDVEDLIPVENVLASVADKSGLENLVPELVSINPNIRFISTGGTYGRIKDILGDSYANNLIEVAEYTNFPEMQGGLVKTLHPKIHAGLLAERNNPEHQRYLREDLDGGVYIDMVVVNLYPFEQMVGKIDNGEIDPKTEKPFNFESARGNIDIGGPTMIRAAAKNFPSCAVVCRPEDYGNVLEDIKENEGRTTLLQRLLLAEKVFEMTSKYDTDISKYFRKEINKGADEIVEGYIPKK